jgi:hypothetical protein
MSDGERELGEQGARCHGGAEDAMVGEPGCRELGGEQVIAAVRPYG